MKIRKEFQIIKESKMFIEPKYIFSKKIYINKNVNNWTYKCEYLNCENNYVFFLDDMPKCLGRDYFITYACEKHLNELGTIIYDFKDDTDVLIVDKGEKNNGN